MATILAGVVLTVALVGGCPAGGGVSGRDGSVSPDGGGPRGDGAILSDGGGDSFAEVAIDGCRERIVSDSEYLCRGPVPLDLRFFALATASATSFLWDFGDASALEGAPAAHRYEEAGEYGVTLVVGGPFGTVSPARPIRVVAELAPVGGFCTDAAQCASDDCLCADPTGGCPAVLQGTCTADCTIDPCASGICADLRIAGAGTPVPLGDDVWRARRCLAGCVSPQDCPRSEQRCRELPSVDSLGTRAWHATCFPEILSDVGDSCSGPDGLPDSAQCLSGDCASLGAFGLCVEDCLTSGCPGYAACAVFNGGPRAGEAVCLARCTAERPCAGDPGLACELAGDAGDLGFTVLDTGEPPGTPYCAPRRCAGNGDCPLGRCDPGGGYCR